MTSCLRRMVTMGGVSQRSRDLQPSNNCGGAKRLRFPAVNDTHVEVGIYPLPKQTRLPVWLTIVSNPRHLSQSR